MACSSSLEFAKEAALQPLEQHSSPQRSASASTPNASVTARPQAVSLGELPAEVSAKAVCFCSARLEHVAWLAGLCGVRDPSRQLVCFSARGLDTGLPAADSLQVRTARCQAAQQSAARGSEQGACYMHDLRFKEPLRSAVLATLHPDITGRLWRALGRHGAAATAVNGSAPCARAAHLLPDSLWRERGSRVARAQGERWTSAATQQCESQSWSPPAAITWCCNSF